MAFKTCTCTATPLPGSAAVTTAGANPQSVMVVTYNDSDTQATVFEMLDRAMVAIMDAYADK